jgi:ABC-type bacteriocin/lantibiotic exporter with double-glycine peptidase domain
MIMSMENIYDVLTGIEKLGFVTDLPLETDEGLCFSEIDKGNGLAVQTRELCFAYQGASKPALNHINLDIAPGERVCIAGYNGAGKSTLVKVISGLYTDYQGVVSYNGFPFKSLNINSLREHVGDFCTLEGIFQGTVLENIAMGHAEVSLEDAIWAAKKMHLDDYINELPQGYNTTLTAEGRNIPHGARMKIILARAIATRPQLLAMESFLRVLDPEDRTEIATFLTQKDNNWTLVAASNDPLLASRCDKVIVMENGEIVQTGTFEEVMKGPHYEKVFNISGEQINN